jgi:hypothetical protein
VADQKEQQPVDIGELLKELSYKIERVKQLYEQYFMGIEKIEPLTARKEVQRAMLELQQQYIRNTGLRFKFQTMLQKWNIYITYWNRILREIENGTYVRHVAKATRAAAREGKEIPEEILKQSRGRPASGTFDVKGAAPRKSFLDADSEPNLATIPASKDETDPGLERVPAKTPPPIPQRPPPIPQKPPPIPPRAQPPAAAKPLPAVPGMSVDDLRALHQKYAATRKQAGEPEVKFETLVNSLARQVGKVLEQPGVKGVRFDVDLKDGKTILKAIPQRK